MGFGGLEIVEERVPDALRPNMREQLKTLCGLLLESQGRNLAVTVLYMPRRQRVPYALRSNLIQAGNMFHCGLGLRV